MASPGDVSFQLLRDLVSGKANPHDSARLFAASADLEQVGEQDAAKQVEAWAERKAREAGPD